MNGGHDLPNFYLIFGGAALLILAPFTALIIWVIKRAKQMPDNEGKNNDHPPHD